MARLLFTYTFTSNGKHTVNVFENRIANDLVEIINDLI